MKLTIPFRVARVGISADQNGVKFASVSMVPKQSTGPHDITAALWGNKYPPNGELIMHALDPQIVSEMEPGSSVNLIIEVL